VRFIEKIGFSGGKGLFCRALLGLPGGQRPGVHRFGPARSPARRTPSGSGRATGVASAGCGFAAGSHFRLVVVRTLAFPNGEVGGSTMFRRKKDERPASNAPTAERGGDRPAEHRPAELRGGLDRALDRPIDRSMDRPMDRGALDRHQAADRPPPPFAPQAAENVEMPRMIATRPTAPAVPSLQSPPSHQTGAHSSAAPPAQAVQPPQPPSLPPASPPKPMVPFVAPAQPGFAVRPPQ